MTTTPSRPYAPRAGPSVIGRCVVAALVLLLSAAEAHAGEPPASAPLRVAVYDVPPYGSVEREGSIDGVSVDLWRRAAEAMGRDYRLVPVHEIEALLEGLERKDYDAGLRTAISDGRSAY